MKKIIRGLAALLFAAGFAMLAYPLLGELRQEAENRQMIQAFEQKKTAGGRWRRDNQWFRIIGQQR